MKGQRLKHSDYTLKAAATELRRYKRNKGNMETLARDLGSNVPMLERFIDKGIPSHCPLPLTVDNIVKWADRVWEKPMKVLTAQEYKAASREAAKCMSRHFGKVYKGCGDRRPVTEKPAKVGRPRKAGLLADAVAVANAIAAHKQRLDEAVYFKERVDIRSGCTLGAPASPSVERPLAGDPRPHEVNVGGLNVRLVDGQELRVRVLSSLERIMETEVAARQASLWRLLNEALAAMDKVEDPHPVLGREWVALRREIREFVNPTLGTKQEEKKQ